MPADPIIRVEDFTAGYDGNVLLHDVELHASPAARFSSSSAARAAARARS